MKCELCGKEFKNLSSHLKKSHDFEDEEIIEYYNKYLKIDLESHCLICGKPTEFASLNLGYNKYCSKKCRNRSLSISNKVFLTEEDERAQKELKYKSDIIDDYHESLKKEAEEAECLICGKYYANLGYHVGQAHNISPKEYYNKYLKKDNDGICVVCGRPTRFYSLSRGYIRTCSSECNCKDELRKQKAEETLLSNYGVEVTFKSKEIQDKAKSTIMDRYGVDNVSKSKEIQDKIKATNLEKYGYEVSSKSPEVKEKVKKTCLEKYGVEAPMQLQEVKDKVADTNLIKYGGVAPACSLEVQEKMKNTNTKRYGCSHAMQNEEIKNRASNTLNNRREKMRSNGYMQLKDLISAYGQGWYKSKVLEEELFKRDNNSYLHISNIPIIEDYISQQKTTSCFEREVRDYVTLIYDKKIVHNDRNAINPLELDIYMPEKKLAIECNGVYWHSVNIGTDPVYHLNKTKMCLDNSIRLIHINDWEWNNKQDICKSIINSAIGKYNSRIYARKCKIKEVPINEAREFLNTNHLQGYVNSSMRIGLYYKEELVQIITLGKSRFKASEYELLRMCTKLNTQVIGGFSKLMSHLVSCIPSDVNEIISYVDRSKFTGVGYIETGWVLMGETAPGYAYYKNGERYSRQKCQKHKLQSLLGSDNFNSELTETENMMNNNYSKVYDCGNLKMKLELKRRVIDNYAK